MMPPERLGIGSNKLGRKIELPEVEPLNLLAPCISEQHDRPTFNRDPGLDLIR
jgi:hypothetical protein